MRTKNEGKNCFSNYDTIQFYFDYERTYKITSIQLTFGGYAKCLNENYRTSVKLYNHSIRQYFRKRIRDGYYQERFIYLDGFPDIFYLTGQGTVFNRIFFHLEETYDKKFVIDYFKSMFDELNDLHKNHDDLEFIKYKNRKVEQVA